MKLYRNTIYFLLLTFVHTTCTYAQQSKLQLGIKIGGGITKTSDINKILVPEDYYSNYTFKDSWQGVPSAEVFVQYHPENGILGVESGIAYWQKASKLTYDDKATLHYEVTPRYNFLGLAAMLKIYPFRHGLYIAIGGRAGANLNSKDISYISNQEDEQFSKYHFASASETERLMKEKLTGRPDVSIGGGLGYEIGSHWGIDIRYYYGLVSTIKTETNDYNWVEHSNHSHNLELTASYLFNL